MICRWIHACAGWAVVAMTMAVTFPCRAQDRAKIVAVPTVGRLYPSVSDVSHPIAEFRAGDTVRVSACMGAWCRARLPSGASAWVVVDALADPGEDLEKARRLYERAGFQDWDPVDWSIWDRVRKDTNMLDACALKLAHGRAFDRETDWPAYCNKVERTPVVLMRSQQLVTLIHSLHLSAAQEIDVREGRIWIGATHEAVEAAWGRPAKVNRTITAAGVREQWVYGAGTYVYFLDGTATAIQN